MKKMYLIWTGRFYTNGETKIIFSEKELAISYLKSLGYKECKESWENNLFEIETDGISYWARIDEIFFGG